MNKTDRKPGVKLVTDYPVRREPMLTIRIPTSVADALIAPQSSVAAIRARKDAEAKLREAVAKAKAPRNVNL